MKKYILLGFLVFLLSFGVVLAENYRLKVGESVLINGNNISLENVGSSGAVRVGINGIGYTISGTERHAGFEITVVDYYYSDALASRSATLGIFTYKTEGALIVDESTVFEGNTIVLQNVGSAGAVRVSVDGVFCTISGRGLCNGIEITVVDYYYTDLLANRWAKLSFGKITTTTTLGPTIPIPSDALGVGQSLEVYGKIVKLENVGSSGSVMVSVDGVLCTISVSGLCNGITITISEYHYDDYLLNRWAKLSFKEGGVITTTITRLPSSTTTQQPITTTSYVTTTTIPQTCAQFCAGYISICADNKFEGPQYNHLVCGGQSTDQNRCFKRQGHKLTQKASDCSGKWCSCYICNEVALSFCQGGTTTTIISNEISDIFGCNNGCLFNNVCIPFGNRVEVDDVPSYCDIDKTIKPQKEMEEFCMNDYECKSNDCSDDKCVSTYNLLQRVLNMLKNIFGFRIGNIISSMRWD